MRKLICFVAILALAAATQAVPVLSLSSDKVDNKVLAGDIVTITITSNSVTGSFKTNLAEATTSAAGYANATLGTIPAAFTTTHVAGQVCNVLSGTRYMLIDRINGVVNTANSDPELGVGAALYTFTVTIPTLAAVGDTFRILQATGSPVVHTGPGYATASYDILTPAAGTATTIGEIVLTVVAPEPMTVALLSLGGLFLRRRK